MKIYRLINPSDPYTIEAEENLIADLAGLFIGSGKTSVEEVNGDFKGFSDILGMLTDEDLRAYFKKTHNYDFSMIMKDKETLTKLADCLASIFYGDESYRIIS